MKGCWQTARQTSIPSSLSLAASCTKWSIDRFWIQCLVYPCNPKRNRLGINECTLCTGHAGRGLWTYWGHMQLEGCHRVRRRRWQAQIITKIAIYVFRLPLRKFQRVIELSNGEIEMSTPQMIGNEIWVVEVQMSGFVKLEGCAEHLNQFHVGWHVDGEKFFPSDGIY